MNKTLEQVLTSFETLLIDGNDYVKTFGFGGLTNLISKTDIEYPLVWIDNVLQVNQYKSGVYIFKFDILIMDLVYDDNTNEKYVWSDTTRVGMDLINHIRDNFSTYGFFINKRQGDSIDFVNFTEKFVDRVSGTKISVDIEVPDGGSLCENIFN